MRMNFPAGKEERHATETGKGGGRVFFVLWRGEQGVGEPGRDRHVDKRESDQDHRRKRKRPHPLLRGKRGGEKGETPSRCCKKNSRKKKKRGASELLVHNTYREQELKEMGSSSLDLPKEKAKKGGW